MMKMLKTSSWPLRMRNVLALVLFILADVWMAIGCAACGYQLSGRQRIS